MTITIPWPHVKPDNHRAIPVRRHGVLRLIASPEYRQAKAACELLVRSQWRQPPLAGELALVARFWFPDYRKRDQTNYAKLLQDALSGIVYADDSQLVDVRLVRVAVDKANPRVELTVTTLEQAAA